jgi:hypothetical protein
MGKTSVKTTKKPPLKIRNYLSQIGRRGGLKSRRHLDSSQASLMVKVREARRAFRTHYARCFWSYDPELKIKIEDISWVAEQLMKNGNRALWLIGRKLCP